MTERIHRHGSAMRPPMVKGELIRHLEAMHGSTPIDGHRWTVAALVETHREWHRKWSNEGLEQA